MDLSYVKEIFDPIYGFIRLTQDEIDIIDKLLFQRLHNINQLGTLHMVFPTARNTRFSHSLGVLAVTSKIIDNFKKLPEPNSKIIEKFDLRKKDQELVRAAALLHDIGHLPYSHCTENVIKDYILEKYPNIEIKKKFHEWLSGEIIKKTDIYNPKGQDPNIIAQDRENISQIIQGTSGFPLLNQILHSELDADRMDYLVRDSFSTGVSFGQIDMDQILRKLFIKERSSTLKPLSDNIIVYSTKAINAIDNFYFARMFMFNSVYYHKVKCYFDYLLSESYRIMINSDNLKAIEDSLPLKPDVVLSLILDENNLTKEEIQDFFILWHKYDDYYLWNCMRDCWHKLRDLSEKDSNSDLKLLKTYLDLLFQRKKSALVWEINRLKSVNENNNEEKIVLDSILESVFGDLETWIKSELSTDYEMPLIVLNNKVDAPLSNIRMEDPENPNEYQGELILFHNPDTDQFHYLNNVQSSINFQTNKSEFHIFRVFCPEEECKEELYTKIDSKYSELIDSYMKEDNNSVRE